MTDQPTPRPIHQYDFPKQHHLLIGLPGSGKSTFAQTLQKHLIAGVVISTDEIRRRLYGDPTIQGYWPEIFSEVLHQIHQAVAEEKTIIYDATNAKRPWRFHFLLPLLQQYPDHTWVGWHLTTPLQTCLYWNQQRERQVPPTILEALHPALEAFPPEPGEGMVMVQQVDPSRIPDLSAEIGPLLAKLPRQIINRKNATQNTSSQFHAYSKLLDFERLLYLLRALLDHPGANPEGLSILLSQRDPLYGDATAVTQNLDWLSRNGFLSAEPSFPEWDLPEHLPPPCTHGYSERGRFVRLMGILRFMIHHPFSHDEGALQSLAEGLRDLKILEGSVKSSRDNLRKDIELILKPYGLLEPHRYKQGYFLGTGIFSHAQLVQLHQLIAGQAKSLGDPTVLALLNTLDKRLQWSKFSDFKPYPVRALYNFTIVNQKHLPKDALINTLDRLEQEIEQGQCLALKRFPGVGRYPTEPEEFFLVWPVQIVFYNIGWYLGYEIAEGPKKGLLGFTRLDRVFRGTVETQHRDRKAQERACQHLEQLFKASGGLFLGENPTHQHQWLSGKPAQRQAIKVMLELWCTDRAFGFMSEGDQRFPADQMQFSPRLADADRSSNPQLFCLDPTGDSVHPHRLQVELPYWALDGVDLQRWIWGFKEEVRVVSPEGFVEEFRQKLGTMTEFYSTPEPKDDPDNQPDNQPDNEGSEGEEGEYQKQ